MSEQQGAEGPIDPGPASLHELEKTVDDWVERLHSGDQDAARELWSRYFQKLVRLASRRLGGASRRAADEEDVALSAFESFFRGIDERRFPRLRGHDDLWRILAVITTRKAIAQIRKQQSQKRGSGMLRGESVFAGLEDDRAGIGAVPARDPGPDFAAAVAEEFDGLLARLPDKQLREVAVMKLQGYRNEEIAQRMNCVVRTVERKLRLIRDAWSDLAPPEGTSDDDTSDEDTHP